MVGADRVLKVPRTTMTCPQGANQPAKTVLIMLLPEQKPSLVWLCPALCNNQTAETVQQSTLNMAEVQNTNECLAAVFLRDHTGHSVPTYTLSLLLHPHLWQWPHLLLYTVCQETKGQLRPTILNLNYLASP